VPFECIAVAQHYVNLPARLLAEVHFDMQLRNDAWRSVNDERDWLELGTSHKAETFLLQELVAVA
jgi:hypothetical protein